MDVWSLVHWLKFDLYADSIKDFKVEIERPCKVDISVVINIIKDVTFVTIWVIFSNPAEQKFVD